jgi:hypothetical protein
VSLPFWASFSSPGKEDDILLLTGFWEEISEIL